MTSSRRLLLFTVNRASTFTASCPQYRRLLLPSLTSCRVFSSSFDKDNNDLSSSSGTEQHKEYLKQMQELQDERQELFGFTEQEQVAWSNHGAVKVHSTTLMDAVEQARQAGGDMMCSASSEQSAPQQPQQQQQEHPHHSVDYRQEEAVECTSTTSTASSVFPPQIQPPRQQDDHDESNAVFTHLNKDSTSVNMVDVGGKQVTRRIAKARSVVKFPPEVMVALDVTNDVDQQDLVGPKGPIFATAKVAGIMAAKRTWELIPLCHPLAIEKVRVDIRLDDKSKSSAIVECECRVTHTTGVEMEALVGASVAALTIYDMVKAISHRVSIEQTVLVSKTGGKRRIVAAVDDDESSGIKEQE